MRGLWWRGVPGFSGGRFEGLKGVIVHFIVRAVVRRIVGHCARLGARGGGFIS